MAAKGCSRAMQSVVAAATTANAGTEVSRRAVAEEATAVEC